MNKVNWLKIAGIFAVVGMVLITLFSFTAFLRGLPAFRLSIFINFVISLFTTVSAVFYISKTNYGDNQNILTDSNDK